MDEKEISRLASAGVFEDCPLKGKVEQTHISWAILSTRHAFKIKKPVKLSFLDFSSLAKRKKYCEAELELNKRFSSIYLAVLPVRFSGHFWQIGNGPGKIMDYALVMKRMMPSKRMDKLLKKRKVKKGPLILLAKNLAAFHKSATIIKSTFDLQEAQATFNDIESIARFTKESLGNEYENTIDAAVKWSNRFLETHTRRIQERIRLGFKRDVHGDLHSGNVFLYKKPVMFDCIEFNHTYRQIDVISEIAFLCMDLEAFGEHVLADLFKTEYLRHLPCLQKEEDEQVFVYYKCMRANIRAKVHAISAQQEPDPALFSQHVLAMKTYLELVKAYIQE